MKKLSFMTMLAMAALLAACNEKKQEQEAIPMQVETAAQVEISGNRASLVKADTTALVIVRDSVADEEVDTIYDIHATLTLLLDSIFIADKMEETLVLELFAADGSSLAQLTPVDTLLADSLMSFLKQEAGTAIEITFVGKIDKDYFLKLQDAANVSLSGFSFHELDPESLADPKITSQINQFEKLAKEINNDIREFGYMGVGVARAEEIAIMRIKLNGIKSDMTPKQLERFQYILSNYETQF